MNNNNEYWKSGEMVEINLDHPDDFLIIKETLTRIGVASHKSNTLYQSCHILHKAGRYYIVHFKEMFLLDGRDSDFSLSDKLRRNAIVKLLSSWELCGVVDKSQIFERDDVHNIKIIKSSDRSNWNLESKYTIGNK